jgi:hypothetical protein
LFKGFEAVNFNVYMCDTDSINSPLKMDASMVDDDAYGKFKYEHTAREAIFLRSKLYAKVFDVPYKGELELIKNKGIYSWFLKQKVGYKGVRKWYDDYTKKGVTTVDVITERDGITRPPKARSLFAGKDYEHVAHIIDQIRIKKSQYIADDKRVQLPDSIHTKPLHYVDDVLVRE